MPPIWTKSPYCGNAACVEVARTGADILVRDEAGSVVPFDPAAWKAFTAYLKGPAGSLLVRP